MTEVKVSAPGKIIIIGEYAVLSDAPAISMAVNQRAKVTIKRHQQEMHLLKTRGYSNTVARFKIGNTGSIEWIDTITEDPIRLFFESAWSHINFHSDFFYEFNLDTTGFYTRAGGDKYGIGSSAALAVAMAAGFVKIFNITQEVKELASQIHNTFQNNRGSGVDIETSSIGGVIKFYRNPEKKSISLDLPKSLKFKIFWSGAPFNTVTQLEKLGSLDKRSFLELREMAIGIDSVLAQYSNEVFIDYLKKYTNILGRFSEEYDLDIFSNRHDILTDKAKKYPNTVYKPCGAGGDIGICFSLSEKTLETFESMACQNGFELLDLDLDESGFSLKG
tara:strand:- start:4310 stop:5308 length:999 start_codon:yes stop_codon:yes gene_type:complete